MDEQQINREIEDRAAVVADWLRDRLAERPCWLMTELAMLASHQGIDLEMWRLHPSVRPVALTWVMRFPWCKEALLIAVAREQDPDTAAALPMEPATAGEVQ